MMKLPSPPCPCLWCMCVCLYVCLYLCVVCVCVNVKEIIAKRGGTLCSERCVTDGQLSLVLETGHVHK